MCKGEIEREGEAAHEGERATKASQVLASESCKRYLLARTPFIRGIVLSLANHLKLACTHWQSTERITP